MGTIVGNFLRKIKGIFQKLTKYAKKITPSIIELVTNIKTFVDSPGADFLTAIIPGTLDDTTKALLREYLPKLLEALNKVETIAAIPDDNERLKAIVANIQLSPDDAKDIFWHGIAFKLIEVIGGVSRMESITLAQGVYEDPNFLNA